MGRDDYATDVVCFNKIPGAFLSKPRKKKRQNEIRAAVPMQYYKAVCRFCCSLYLSATAKRLKEKDQREVTLVFRFTM